MIGRWVVFLALASLAAGDLQTLEGAPSGAPPSDAFDPLDAHGPIGSPAERARGPEPTDVPTSLAAWVARIEAVTHVDARDPLAPAGLRGLAALADEAARPAGARGAQQQNVTNTTTIPGFGNGTLSHHHGNVGDLGLSPVWASIFYGVPLVSTSGDLDADGVVDVVIGTDLAIAVVSGATGGQMWARHIGSAVTAVFVFDAGGMAGLEVGYSTLWEAQTPRVGVLAGRTGAIQWEHIGETPFLTAAAASAAEGSDVVAIDVDGIHTRLSAATGEPVWTFDTDLLQDPGAGTTPVPVHSNLGTYLATTADLDGDGTTDTISVGAYQYALNWYSVIHAVDGATGQRMWLTNVGGDPHVIAQGIVYDIDALDTQGDGSFDIAYSFLVLRYDAVGTVLFYWEQGWRVSKGDSDTVGVPIASHTVVTPVVPVEVFTDLEHTDVDGDGRHELATLHELVTNSVLGEDLLRYERYSLPPFGSTADPTLILVSDVSIAAGNTARIVAFDRDGDGGRDHSIARFVDDTGTWTVVAAEGQLDGPHDTGRDFVRVAQRSGDRIAVGLGGVLQWRPADDLAVVTEAMALHGAPRIVRFADADLDGTADAFVLASDGAVHVVDGLTGLVNASIAVGSDVRDIAITAIGGSSRPDVLLVRSDAEGFGADTLEGWDGESGTRLYSRGPTAVFQDPAVSGAPVWFDGDGDGDLDFLHEWDLTDDSLVAAEGSIGRDLWRASPALAEGTNVTRWLHGSVGRFGGVVGEDLLLAAGQGLLIVDGGNGRTLGWHPVASNGSNALGRGPITCMGGADADADGVQSVYAIHSGSVGDLARRLDNGTWTVLDWVPDQSDVVRCVLQAVKVGAGREHLLVSMVWTGRGDDAGEAGSRVGRYDPATDAWVWEIVRNQPLVEVQAYFSLGADVGADGEGRVFFAWQDHVYALEWSNGTAIGEFAVNGPFVLAGGPLDLDGQRPAEAIVLAADGLLWALAEDRDAVAARLADKADDQGKASNYGVGEAFEAPPLEKESKKNGIPPAPFPWLAIALAAAVWTARRR